MLLSHDTSGFVYQLCGRIYRNRNLLMICAENISVKLCVEYSFLYFFAHNTTEIIVYHSNGQFA